MYGPKHAQSGQGGGWGGGGGGVHGHRCDVVVTHRPPPPVGCGGPVRGQRGPTMIPYGASKRPDRQERGCTSTNGPPYSPRNSPTWQGWGALYSAVGRGGDTEGLYGHHGATRIPYGASKWSKWQERACMSTTWPPYSPRNSPTGCQLQYALVRGEGGDPYRNAAPPRVYQQDRAERRSHWAATPLGTTKGTHLGHTYASHACMTRAEAATAG